MQQCAAFASAVEESLAWESLFFVWQLVDIQYVFFYNELVPAGVQLAPPSILILDNGIN
jgi:hypothetical protein